MPIVATGVWTLFSRRQEYVTLHKWFFVFIRFALAAQMFYYGMAKVIPIQFMPPALTTLVQPVGALSLSTLLWVFVGASPIYQLFGGVAEIVAAVALVFPRATTLGAAVTLWIIIESQPLAHVVGGAWLAAGIAVFLVQPAPAARS